MATDEDSEPTILCLQARANERLTRIRAELARHLQARLYEKQIGLREAAKEIGIETNMLFRLSHPESEEYSNPRIEPVAVVLEWLGLTWGDLDRAQVCRKLTLADARLALLDLDLSQQSQQVMIEINDALYRALKGMP